MSLDTAFAIKVFMAMFAIMNPIANIPIFLSLTEGCSEAEKRRTASIAFFGVTIGCFISALAGSTILNIFGLTVNDFRLAGGLLVLLIALSMLHGSPSSQHQPQDEEIDGGKSAQDIAIYPLTIPLMIGPGSIATLIIFGHTAMTEGKFISLTAGLAVFLVLLAISLFSAPYLARYLSSKVTAIAQRLMGMILAAIAMQMIIASLQIAFKNLGG